MILLSYELDERMPAKTKKERVDVCFVVGTATVSDVVFVVVHRHVLVGAFPHRKANDAPPSSSYVHQSPSPPPPLLWGDR